MRPRLHLVTDDEVLRDPAFRPRAARVLAEHGTRIALHVRGHGLGGRELHGIAAELREAADAAGATLLVNDRVDVALTAGADGVQLGRRSLPIERARALLGIDAWIGWSAHDAGRGAKRAVDAGADFVVVGTIYPTASHPGRPAAGPGRVESVVARTSAPVIAIGGVTPARVPELREAGAYGVAVLSGVWRDPDPAVAVGRYLAMLESEGGDLDERFDGS
ncbi:MAG: thiamine phosphate synthase [Gemmatimonadota bacterium]